VPLYEEPPDGVVLAAEMLLAWTRSLVVEIGTPEDIAADVAEVLVAADARGIASHGTARLEQYVRLIDAGVVDPAARPVVVRSRAALSLLDAANGWGHHAGRVAMDRAIAGAAETGTSISIVRNTNHFGIAGWYAMRAAARGMIGISLTNSSPLVAPTRGRVPMIGTNPIAVAVPAGRHGQLVLDMATSTVPRGRIEVAARRGERLPPGWAIAADGTPALTPEAALEGALQPLGGQEETGGYKGYGLALVVDILTGVLAGAHFGPNIVGLFSTDAPSDLGQLFGAIDVDAVHDRTAFEQRVDGYIDQLAAAPRIPNAPGPVLYPGQPEAERAARNRRQGIVVDRAHYESLARLAARFGLPAPAGAPRSGEARD